MMARKDVSSARVNWRCTWSEWIIRTAVLAACPERALVARSGSHHSMNVAGMKGKRRNSEDWNRCRQRVGGAGEQRRPHDKQRRESRGAQWAERLMSLNNFCNISCRDASFDIPLRARRSALR